MENNERLELQTKAFMADLLAGVNKDDSIQNNISYMIYYDLHNWVRWNRSYNRNKEECPPRERRALFLCVFGKDLVISGTLFCIDGEDQHQGPQGVLRIRHINNIGIGPVE